jgi:hypothetical protein
MKVAKVSKNIKGDLCGDLWEAATTLIAANQALSLRAEVNIPQERGDDEPALGYEVSRLRRENQILREEIRLLRERMERMNKAPFPKRSSPPPEERERRRREKRRVIRFSSFSNFSPVKFLLQKLAGSKAYRDDEHPVLRPVIMGVKRRLDAEESPIKIPVPPTPLPQTQESVKTVVKRVLGKFIPGLLQQLGGIGCPGGAMPPKPRPLAAKPPAATKTAAASGTGATLAPPANPSMKMASKRGRTRGNKEGASNASPSTLFLIPQERPKGLSLLGTLRRPLPPPPPNPRPRELSPPCRGPK